MNQIAFFNYTSNNNLKLTIWSIKKFTVPLTDRSVNK